MNYFSNGYALLVGVGADLPVTVDDATALYKVLIDPNLAAYSPENIQLLTGPTAGRQDILNAFDNLIKQVAKKPDATIFIYFSGHGGRIQYLDKPHEYFLVPYGFDPNNRPGTTITGLEFTQKIEAIKARKLVVMLDCCHAGGIPTLKEPGATFVKSPIPQQLLSMLDMGSGRVIVASSHEQEYSYTGTRYSVFTACLLEALSGRADIGNDGFVRILNILIYLFRCVPQRSPGPQHPFVKKVLDLGDNFPLCYSTKSNTNLADDYSDIDSAKMPIPLTLGQRHRIEQKLGALQAEWDLRSEKVKRMRAALVIETSVTVNFQLEQQLLDEEMKLANLSNELKEVEKTLGKERGN